MEHDAQYFDEQPTDTMFSPEYLDMILMLVYFTSNEDKNLLMGIWEATCPGSLDEVKKHLAESKPEGYEGNERDFQLAAWPGVCQNSFRQGLALLPS